MKIKYYMADPGTPLPDLRGGKWPEGWIDLSEPLQFYDLARGVPALHPERKGQLNRSPKQNWVEKAGNLPPYINSVATALVREGKTREEAIQIAVNMAKKTCSTGRIMNLPNKPKVSGSIQAAFCDAVRKWEAMKASTRVDASEDGEKWTDRRMLAHLEIGETAAGIWPTDLPDDLGAQDCLIELSEEEGWSVEDFVPEGEDVMHQEWLLPFDFSEAEKIGSNLFKKQIVPLNSKIVYDGKVLEFTKPVLEGMVETFKEKPVDYCPFTLVNEKNQHTDDPERERGTVEDLSLESDGLYMIGKLDPRGKQLVDNNPQLGVSVRYAPEYHRSDGRRFSHALLHVAGTPRPRLPGQKPWERVDLSTTEEEEVIDLSEAQWETVHENVNEEEELDKNAEGGTNQAPTEEQKVTVDLSDPELKHFVDAAIEEAVKAEREANQAEINKIKTQAKVGEVTRVVESAIERGVPPYVANLAAPLLLENDADGDKVKFVDMSEGEDGQARNEEREASRYELVTKMLDAWPGQVDMSEELGTQEGEGSTGDDTESVWKAWRASSSPGASVSGGSE